MLLEATALPNHSQMTTNSRLVHRHVASARSRSKSTINSRSTRTGVPQNSTCYYFDTPGLRISSNYSCDPGFLCLNTDPYIEYSLPAICPPSYGCQTLRLFGKFCDPQGPFEPVVCPAGNFCPNFNNITRCPEGYYCPTGSTSPTQCDNLSFCPKGTARPTQYLGLIICGTIDALLFTLLIVTAIYNFLMHIIRIIASVPKTLGIISNRSARDEDDDTSVPPNPKQLSAGKSLASTSFPSLYDMLRESFGGRDLHMNIGFRGLCVENFGRTIIKDVTGETKSSRLTAIMGPPGSGKTILLQALCGRIRKSLGDVFVNGQPADIHKYKSLFGFIAKENVMMQDLTVRENVLHSARCRVPKTWKFIRIKHHVENVLNALHLSEVSDLIVGDDTNKALTALQRKQVSLAMELAAVPICLFVDEPTFGLDNTSSLDMVSMLQNIAQLGVAVVITIQHPRSEIIHKFDDLIILTRSGRLAYHGPTMGARMYFQGLGFEFDRQANDADIMMDIVVGKGINRARNISPQDLPKLWSTRASDLGGVYAGPRLVSSPLRERASTVGSRTIDMIKTGDLTHQKQLSSSSLRDSKTASVVNLAPTMPGIDTNGTLLALALERGSGVWKQLYYCYIRALFQEFRACSSLLVEVVLASCLGLIIGLPTRHKEYIGMFRQPYVALSPAQSHWLYPMVGLAMGIAIALFSSSPAATIFTQERPMINRESMAGHSVSAYYWAKTIATKHRICITALHFASTYIFMSRSVMSLVELFLIIALNVFCVYGISAVVSALASKTTDARVASIIINVLIASVCGYGPSLLHTSQWNVLPMWEISPNRWSTEALIDRAVAPFDHIYNVSLTSDLYGYTLDRYWFDLAMMGVIGFAARLIAYLLMLANTYHGV